MAAPTAPAGPAPASAPTAEISPGWSSAVSAWIQSHKTYPDEARRRGEQGRAQVRFTVNREGRVLEFQLLRGSGSAALDAAVQQMFQAARLPSFPSGMTQDRTTVTVQIRYALEP